MNITFTGTEDLYFLSEKHRSDEFCKLESKLLSYTNDQHHYSVNKCTLETLRGDHSLSETPVRLGLFSEKIG